MNKKLVVSMALSALLLPTTYAEGITSPILEDMTTGQDILSVSDNEKGTLVIGDGTHAPTITEGAIEGGTAFGKVAASKVISTEGNDAIGFSSSATLENGKLGNIYGTYAKSSHGKNVSANNNTLTINGGTLLRGESPYSAPLDTEPTSAGLSVSKETDSASYVSVTADNNKALLHQGELIDNRSHSSLAAGLSRLEGGHVTHVSASGNTLSVDKGFKSDYEEIMAGRIMILTDLSRYQREDEKSVLTATSDNNTLVVNQRLEKGTLYAAHIKNEFTLPLKRVYASTSGNTLRVTMDKAYPKDEWSNARSKQNVAYTELNIGLLEPQENVDIKSISNHNKTYLDGNGGSIYATRNENILSVNTKGGHVYYDTSHNEIHATNANVLYNDASSYSNNNTRLMVQGELDSIVAHTDFNSYVSEDTIATGTIGTARLNIYADNATIKHLDASVKGNTTTIDKGHIEPYFAPVQMRVTAPNVEHKNIALQDNKLDLGDVTLEGFAVGVLADVGPNTTGVVIENNTVTAKKIQATPNPEHETDRYLAGVMLRGRDNEIEVKNNKMRFTEDIEDPNLSIYGVYTFPYENPTYTTENNEITINTNKVSVKELNGTDVLTLAPHEADPKKSVLTILGDTPLDMSKGKIKVKLPMNADISDNLLIDAPNSAIKYNPQNIAAQKGVSIDYILNLKESDKNLHIEERDKVYLMPQTKIMAETPLASFSMVKDGIEKRMPRIEENEVMAMLSRSSHTYDTGSSIKDNLTHLHLGIRKKVGGLDSDLFVHYGTGSYDSKIHDNLQGKGNEHYLGLGMRTYHKVGTDKELMAGVHLGTVHANFSSTDMKTIDGKTLDTFSYHAPFYGLMLELRDNKKGEKPITTFVGYKYLHQGSFNTHILTGENYHFSAVSGHTLYVGGEVNKKTKYGDMFTSLTLEHVFGTKSTGYFSHHKSLSPNVNGLSAVLGLGIKKSAARMDYAVSLVTSFGKKRGTSLSASVTYKF